MINKDEAIGEGLKNLPAWLIQRVRTYLAFRDYSYAMEEMYKQGFNDGVKWRAENEVVQS